MLCVRGFELFSRWVPLKESALFIHDERPEQISVDIREEVEASSER